MRFRDIIGHDEIKRHLCRTVRQGRISHAMLFTGAEGVGALPMALAYAQYVHCRNRTDEDSCGECPECYRMQRMEHPDCHYIYPVNASKEAVATGRADEKPRSEQFVHVWRRIVPETGGYLTEQEWYAELGIENQQGIINKNDANELVRQMGFKSFEGGYKTVIVWLPERLHEAAANTLLKLVEEPPERTLFLFVSAEPERIIATIRSRTQTVALAGVPDEVIARELVVRKGIAPERAAQVAHLAQGSWGAAVRMAANAGGVQSEHEERFIRLMRLCYQQKYLGLFDWAEEMAPLGREAQKQFCTAALGIVRECYLTGIGMESIAYADPGRERFCRNFAPYVSHVTVEAFVAEFERLLAQIKQNGNPRILFTHFAMCVCKIIGAARVALKK
ncbi:DNA polymerase III subunit delta [uncultured Rikenella sp.]|uniref:DNA polymerase III subunit n=1 Tax=uncultured Rikenella sp. TaxID=368003 RepID=UPI002602D8DE|nr:DNA polymerase III subunit delta [uncultured Rikenella sp.]